MKYRAHYQHRQKRTHRPELLQKKSLGETLEDAETCELQNLRTTRRVENGTALNDSHLESNVDAGL